MPSRGQQLGKLLNSSGDIVETSLPPKIETFSQSVSNTGKIEASALGDDVSTIEQVSDVSLLTASGNSVGDQRVVGNNLYIWNGVGWYRIALINQTPTWDSGGQPAGAYTLDADSPQDATIITLAASDPDGLPISYSYVTAGSMDSMATISQDSSVFTITPKTLAQVGEGVELTGSITFRASDGVNILPSVSSFTLSFIFIIQNSKYTTLLVAAVDTSDNNNITDSSTNNHTITVNGDAQAGTFSPYRHGGYSTYFDGSGDYLTVPYDASIAEWYTSDYTIEAWVYYNSFNVGSASGSPLIVRHGNATTASNYWSLGAISTGELQFYYYNGSSVTTCISTATLNLNQWHHIVMSHNNTNNEITLYLDGVSVHTHTISGTPQVNSSHTITIGQLYNTSHNGYITDLRITASEVYTTAFTPPTAHLTAITNTQLLACHLPYIADESTNNHSITRTGDVSTRPFTPFDNLEYASGTNGGSVYFDGTGDYLDVSSPPSLGQNNWTFETWYYPTSSGAIYLMSQGNSDTQGATTFSYNFSTGAYNIQIYISNNYYNWSSPTVDVNNNQWNHVALTHEWNGATGGTYKVYNNGTLINSDTHLNKFWEYSTIAGKPLGAGVYKWAGAVTNPVYFSDWRLSNSVVYNSNFTPPTAPLSSTESTLHVKGTDASIIDKSQNANLKLIGNTTGSTTQVKFANTKSMYFDGTSDYLTTGYNSSLVLGTGSLTVELWYYLSNTQIHTIFELHDGYPNGSGTNYDNNRAKLAIVSGNMYLNDGTANLLNLAETQVINQWRHWAWSRDASGNNRFFIDGSQVGTTVSSSNNLITPVVDLGRRAETNSTFMQGYIQDFRLTKGLARYTSNFTPPTVPLKG